ncbi:DUF397 domain-containing protein [Streptomyces sp. NBC_01317]|uniref:DUF397 domain-containing protein n=1 Tax=Streptomyces sp. NBC_01317 TaxID=2903822 RepID=UPI002E11C9FE|nr:DUF397 domain-containing protein [Streptomyces sp. NBC_01317]
MSHVVPGQISAPEWMKSSHSGNNGNCLEVAVLPHGSRAVRDSKIPGSPTLLFTPTQFTAFVRGIAHGQIG